MNGIWKLMSLGLCLLTAQAHAQDWSKLPELEARTAIQREAAETYRSGRLDELDARMTRYVTDSTRTSSGLWISGIYAMGVQSGVLSPRPQTDAEWNALEQKTLAWARQRPGSALARLTHAQVIRERAWDIRGRGYAYKVPESAWKPFHAGLRRAEAYLLKEKKVAAAVPEYYSSMAAIARALDKPRGDIDALLAECDSHHPGYYPLYFEVLEYLLPKWHGDARAIELFAREAVERTRVSEGESMYARIYWYAAQRNYAGALFFETNAQWDLMKSGFEDVVARYPDPWNYQNYAHFACQAADEKTLAALLSEHVTEPILTQAWTGQASYEACGRLVGRITL